MERYDYETSRQFLSSYGILDRKRCNSTYIATCSERWAAESICRALNDQERETQLRKMMGDDVLEMLAGTILDVVKGIENEGPGQD